jgi:hypothetical protein
MVDQNIANISACHLISHFSQLQIREKATTIKFNPEYMYCKNPC